MADKAVLMKGEGLLPIVQDEENVRYTMDRAKRQFRLVDKPWVVCSFDSCTGRLLIRALGDDGKDLVV